MHITLPDESYETAAMAVLAGLYQVQTWRKLFERLTHQQQVQAAVLADMWQLPAARYAALQLLKAVIDRTDGVTAVLEQLIVIPAVPDCLQALLEQVLLLRFGDLEEVWGAEGVSSGWQETLLALPLPAMELLLASDKLEVRLSQLRVAAAAAILPVDLSVDRHDDASALHDASASRLCLKHQPRTSCHGCSAGLRVR